VFIAVFQGIFSVGSTIAIFDDRFNSSPKA